MSLSDVEPAVADVSVGDSVDGQPSVESVSGDSASVPESFSTPSVDEADDRPMTNGERTWPGVVESNLVRTGMHMARKKGKKKRGTRGVPQAWGAWTIPKGQAWVGRRARMIWVQVYDAIEARNQCPPNVSQLAVLSSIIDYQIYADLAKRMGCKKFNEEGFTPRDLKETFGAAAIATSARAKLILSLGVDANELDLFGAALTEDPSADLKQAGIIITQPRDEDEGSI